MIRIKISAEFTDAPGGRHRKDGAFSGEEFRETLLKPRYLEAKQKNDRLFIDLDDCYGYATSFLEEAFGGLAREMGTYKILDIMDFKSEDEPELVEMIKKYVRGLGLKS